MKVATVNAGADLADPASQAWNGVTAEAVALAPVPLAAQPTEYIREAWANRAYGKTAEAKVAAATDGSKLYVRVEWADDSAPNTEFQDAVGAVLGDGPLDTLGSVGSPVTMWYWENGRGALNLVSRGPGVVTKTGASAVSGTGASGPSSSAGPRAPRRGSSAWPSGTVRTKNGRASPPSAATGCRSSNRKEIYR